MEPHAVGGVELLAEGDHVVVGPDPLAVGEPLEGRHAVVHLADEAHEEGLVARETGGNCIEIGLPGKLILSLRPRLNFDSMTCPYYLFLDFFQYRKSQADYQAVSQAVFQAVFWPCELNT